MTTDLNKSLIEIINQLQSLTKYTAFTYEADWIGYAPYTEHEPDKDGDWVKTDDIRALIKELKSKYELQ